jgi:hypothetical protein
VLWVRGRPIASTAWLSDRGVVDASDPPIAGLDSVPSADGLTIQYLYENSPSPGFGNTRLEPFG